MRVVLISGVYPPEPVTSASTSYSLAAGLAQRGHDVTVIASFPNRPGGRVFPGFRRRLLPQREMDDGIEVVRCYSTISRISTLLSRLAQNVSFGISSGLAFSSVRRPDAIYANTWPLFAAGIASCVARIRHVPLVLSIQDVYPESLIAFKKLRVGACSSRLLRWLDAAIARTAAAVVVISRGAEDIYLNDRGVEPAKIHRIPNWREIEDRPAPESGARQRTIWGIGADVFLIVFAGSVVAACGIESVIRAVSELGEESSAGLVIAGSGSALENCRSIAAMDQRQRVKFTGPFPVQDTLSILSAADVLILPTQGDQSLVAMPSKLISYMMSARPVLAIARLESDLAAVVKDSGCGWVIPPEDSAALEEQLTLIATLGRPELARIGASGREYALAHFSTEACLPRLVGVIEGVARQ